MYKKLPLLYNLVNDIQNLVAVAGLSECMDLCSTDSCKSLQYETGFCTTKSEYSYLDPLYANANWSYYDRLKCPTVMTPTVAGGIVPILTS